MSSTALLHPEDVKRIKSGLLKCPREIQQLIQPLLGELVVQKMLLAFVNDGTRSLQDWLCDPVIVMRLETLRQTSAAGLQYVNSHYEEALSSKVGESVRKEAARRIPTSSSEHQVDREHDTEEGEWDGDEEEGAPEDEHDREDYGPETYGRAPGALETCELLMLGADCLRQEGVKEFEQECFVRSAGSFLAAAEQLKELADAHISTIAESHDDASTLSQAVESRAYAMRLKCLCNAAVSYYKAEKFSDVPPVCTQALSLQPSCCKALYWRGRVRFEQGMTDLAVADLNKAMALEPENRAVERLAKAAAQRVVQEEKNRLATRAYKERCEILAKEQEENKAAVAHDEWVKEWARPLPKPPILRTEVVKTPAGLLNEYLMQAKLHADISTEPQPDSLSCEGRCTIVDRFTAVATARNTKLCKQALALVTLRVFAKFWNHTYPTDPIDLNDMVPCSEEERKAAMGANSALSVEDRLQQGMNGRDFREYADSWIRLVAEGKVQKVTFTPALLKVQRADVHAATLEMNEHLSRQEQEEATARGEELPQQRFTRHIIHSHSTPIPHMKTKAVSVMRYKRAEREGGIAIEAMPPPIFATDPGVDIGKLSHIMTSDEAAH
jgi:tetratricopeptide (TPR) repeat protein